MCQQHHWPVHMNTCMQPKTSVVTVACAEAQQQAIPRSVALPLPSPTQIPIHPPSLATRIVDNALTVSTITSAATTSSSSSTAIINGNGLLHWPTAAAINGSTPSDPASYVFLQSQSLPIPQSQAIQFVSSAATQQRVISPNAYSSTVLTRPSVSWRFFYHP